MKKWKRKTVPVREPFQTSEKISHWHTGRVENVIPTYLDQDKVLCFFSTIPLLRLKYAPKAYLQNTPAFASAEVLPQYWVKRWKNVVDFGKFDFKVIKIVWVVLLHTCRNFTQTVGFGVLDKYKSGKLRWAQVGRAAMTDGNQILRVILCLWGLWQQLDGFINLICYRSANI